MSNVSIFGLGKVGHTLAACLGVAGNTVIGCDPVAGIVDAINARRHVTEEPGVEFSFILESANISWASSSSGLGLFCLGWIDNL